MKELVTVYKHQLVTDSRQVADRFEKSHRHVLDAIRNLEKGMPKIGQTPMFYETTYVNEQNGQTYPMYLMNRDGFSLLVMGFKKKLAMIGRLPQPESHIANASRILAETGTVAISFSGAITSSNC